MSGKENKNKKYELVAPDGGWGYMIGLGVIFNLMSITIFTNCFGMIFKELFFQLKMDSTSILFFNGINAFCIAMSGFTASFLLKFMSIRQLGVAAALVFNLGIFGTVFVKSKLHFFISQGILPSIGHGIIFNLSCTMLNYYFVKRRFLAVSFTQTIVAVCTFVSPHFVKWSFETFGFRGTLLFISAVSMHNIFGMTVMQPVSWHMKTYEVPADKENEIASLLEKDKNDVTTNKDLTSSIKSNKSGSAEGSDGIYKDEEEKVKPYSRRRPKNVFRFIELSLFRSFLLSNASVGVCLSVFSDLIFTLMLPQALYFMGWNENEVAWALSMNALGDLVTKVLFIFMSSVLAKIGSHEIYVAGLVIAFVSRLGMLWSDNRRIMMAFITIMGVSRCTILMLLPIVVADAVHQEMFTSAMGLNFLIFGFFNLTVGPIIGAVRDLSDSYSTAFYILTSFFGIVIIFWSIELFYKKSKHKRQSRMDVSTKP